MTALQHVEDLGAFVQASPSSFHAAAEGARRLAAAGFAAQDETAEWDAAPGGHYLVRDGALLAWRIPDGAGPTTAFRILGAHTDSPSFKLKPRPDLGAHGWQQLGVEVYGGPLLNSWLDRELGLAGRVALTDGSTQLLRTGAIMRIPQLAIHLDRSVNEEGVRLDKQQHTAPVWSVGHRGLSVLDHLAEVAGCTRSEIDGYDLVAFDTAAPAVFGPHGEFFASGRLDNLSSVHAGLTALIASPGSSHIELVAAFDHEEVGSGSRSGAAGPVLADVVARTLGALGASSDQQHRAMARSVCLSADAGHAVHPNYAGRHDPANQPRAQRRTAAQAQRQPALRQRRGRHGAVAPGLPQGGGADPGVRVEQRAALRLHHRPADRHAAGHRDHRRRAAAAVHALGPRAGRQRGPVVPQPGGRGLLRTRALNPRNA